MFTGRLIAIQIAPAAALPMVPVQEIEAVAGRGLCGDRYAELKGAFQRGKIEPSQEVTLIEREALEAASQRYELPITHAASRRNLLTEGVPLNHLVGRTFSVGSTTLRGIELCEPCGYLEKHTFEGIKKALLHRGGLRAQIVAGGTLRVGDEVRLVESVGVAGGGA
jgi:MOSC domain-containing protein YiiM